MIDPWTIILWVAVLLLACDLAPLFCYRVARPDIKLRSADWGYVYALQDVRSPDLFKIGMTKRAPLIRSFEISRDMCGGRELRFVAAVHMPFKAAVEAEAHRLLHRQNEISERGREWFRLCDRATAVATIDRAARTVRRVARLRRLWSREAETDWRGAR